MERCGRIPDISPQNALSAAKDLRVGWVLGCSLIVLAVAVRVPASEEEPSFRALRIEPAEVRLRGDNRRQQLLVTAEHADGRHSDATHLVRIQPLDSKIASAEGATIVGLADGETKALIEFGSLRAEVRVRVSGFAEYPPVHFANDVVPILSKLGCNSGGCHGRAAGQNGFKLSVFGFDPAADYDALIKEARGRRIFPSSAEKSLLLSKPTGHVPHGGGQRLKVGSLDYQVLLEWIRQGMPLGRADAPTLVSVRISPAERVVSFGASQQILATARYSDGQERDVTALASYSSNATHVAEVERGGLVHCGQVPGEAAITVSYMGQVAAVKTVIPRPDPPQFPELPVRSPVDSLVWAKLKRMGIIPSEPADDATFLRRVFLDTIGRLPRPDEVRGFLTDSDPNKRSRWIERVLAREEFADLWAMKWADILLVDRQKLGERGAYEFHRWLRQQFADNRPYDQWVRELVTAGGNTAKNGPANLFRAVDTPDGVARALSQALLGVRLECAQCHHHPLERWSQDDFYGLTGFFTGLVRQPVGTKGVLVYHPGLAETRIPVSNRLVPTRVLGGSPLSATEVRGDPRVMLATWITAPENPWFARLAVNRLWKHLFGRGLVEPEDDLRSTNPATNEPLLDYLAGRLVEQRFDLKAVIREILESHVYQLSSVPNSSNPDDEQNFSHYLPRRLPAEVLLDAISDATGSAETFPGYPRGTRAVELWDNRLPSYFLEIFGRPERSSPCECGRASEPTMAQALHLMNAPEIEAKLASPAGRAATLASSSATSEQIAEELTLAALGRFPTDREREVASSLFAAAPRQEAAADYLWTLLNSRDFLLNH